MDLIHRGLTHGRLQRCFDQGSRIEVLEVLKNGDLVLKNDIISAGIVLDLKRLMCLWISESMNVIHDHGPFMCLLFCKILYYIASAYSAPLVIGPHR